MGCAGVRLYHSFKCAHHFRVNLCGKIKLVCFDKTGTLTEESVKTSGVIMMTGNEYVINNYNMVREEKVGQCR